MSGGIVNQITTAYLLLNIKYGDCCQFLLENICGMFRFSLSVCCYFQQKKMGRHDSCACFNVQHKKKGIAL